MTLFKTHRNINLVSGLIASILYYQSNYFSIILFLSGIIESSYLHSSDLDKSTSIPYRNWGPFKYIWKPFSDAGHREILHHFFWGPVILIGSLWFPLYLAGVSFPAEYWYGMIWAIEMHIIIDKLF